MFASTWRPDELSEGAKRRQRPGAGAAAAGAAVAAAAAAKAGKLTKIIVRNVAFEATRKELRELFGRFGHIKSVRLPHKFDGGHRGFAFVDFVTHQEAACAYDALSSTHLYGRHLVL